MADHDVVGRAHHGGGRDKADRATRDQVLDPRTEMTLLRMINKGLISALQGVISTGKEANVYAAVLERMTGEEGGAGGAAAVEYRAAKVYKTAILSFVDRERYIAGEHRFRHGDHKGNHRKMVKKWAEKEFRNLQRLHRAGIPCPYPIQLKGNVLLMSFLGSARGVAYPRLRDVELEGEEEEAEGGSGSGGWRALYVQLLGLVRRLYQECRLVHADLSEYNLLYHAGRLYVIDVSQSVGHDHPQTYDFLRMDIRNVAAFFQRKGVDTLRDRTVFNFVTGGGGAPPSYDDDAALARAVEDLWAAERAAPLSEAERAADDEAFRTEFIPQSLQQVYDAEMVARGDGPAAGEYRNLLAEEGGKDEEEDDEDEDDENDDDDDDGDSDGDSSPSVTNSDEPGQPRGKRFEDKDAKRAHKLAVKEEKRQKRQTKMPKKVKKRLVAQSKK